jgi:hypothetical protein
MVAETKKNVVFWIGVKATDPLLNEKHGGFKYLDISRLSWEWWCKKHDVVFFPYEESAHGDGKDHKITWSRWFEVFDLLEGANIDYDQIALVDGSSIIKWDTPDFFEMSKGHTLSAWKSHENLRWVHEGVTGYKPLFNDFEFDFKKYISCGFQIFNEGHKEFLTTLKEYYFDNYDEVMKYQHELVKRGTDQPVYNYLLQIHNKEVNMDLMPSLFLNHLYRFDWMSHNWQTGDKTPFFLKHGYIYFFSGMTNRGQREQLMGDVWNAIKDNYK